MKKLLFFVITILAFGVSKAQKTISEPTLSTLEKTNGDAVMLDTSLNKIKLVNVKHKRTRLFGPKDKIVFTKIGELPVLNNEQVKSATVTVAPNQTVPGTPVVATAASTLPAQVYPVAQPASSGTNFTGPKLKEGYYIKDNVVYKDGQMFKGGPNNDPFFRDGSLQSSVSRYYYFDNNGNKIGWFWSELSARNSMASRGINSTLYQD